MGRRSKKCRRGCRYFYCYDDRVLCIHELFRLNYVEAIVRTSYGRRVRFELYYDYSPKYKYQTGARVVLGRAEQVTTAIELAKKYQVEMISLDR